MPSRSPGDLTRAVVAHAPDTAGTDVDAAGDKVGADGAGCMPVPAPTQPSGNEPVAAEVIAATTCSSVSARKRLSSRKPSSHSPTTGLTMFSLPASRSASWRCGRRRYRRCRGWRCRRGSRASRATPLIDDQVGGEDALPGEGARGGVRRARRRGCRRGATVPSLRCGQPVRYRLPPRTWCDQPGRRGVGDCIQGAGRRSTDDYAVVADAWARRGRRRRHAQRLERWLVVSAEQRVGACLDATGSRRGVHHGDLG